MVSTNAHRTPTKPLLESCVRTPPERHPPSARYATHPFPHCPALILRFPVDSRWRRSRVVAPCPPVSFSWPPQQLLDRPKLSYAPQLMPTPRPPLTLSPRMISKSPGRQPFISGPTKSTGGLLSVTARPTGSVATRTLLQGQVPLEDNIRSHVFLCRGRVVGR